MKNVCFIFIGPSGSGKTSLAAALFTPEQKIISHTTRAPRAGEQDGIDYFFVSRKRFEAMIQAEAFAEYDDYNGNYYGVTKKVITEKLQQGHCYDVLTVSGFVNLYKLFGQQIIPVQLLISKEETAARMKNRGEELALIGKRLALFQEEVATNQQLTSYPNLIQIDASQSLEKMAAEFKEKSHVKRL